jgi:predicted secreted Zn-dependent protease
VALAARIVGAAARRVGVAACLLGVAACLLGVAACNQRPPGASILPALPPGVRAFTAEVRYDVTGATVEEIRTSLRRSSAEALPGGVTGYHRWDIKWTYRYARAGVYCELSDIGIDLNSTITLPEWHRPDEADPAVVATWDEYMADLRGHEYGHRVLAYQAAREIRRALDRLRVEDCAFIVNEARRVGEAILEQHRERNAEFDADPANRVTWPPRSP